MAIPDDMLGLCIVLVYAQIGYPLIMHAKHETASISSLYKVILRFRLKDDVVGMEALYVFQMQIVKGLGQETSGTSPILAECASNLVGWSTGCSQTHVLRGRRKGESQP